MSDKKPDWQIPDVDADKKSDATKPSDVWSGEADTPERESGRDNFSQFDEVRGRKKARKKPATSRPNGKKRLFVFIGLLVALYWLLNIIYPGVSMFDNPYGAKSAIFLIVIGGSVIYFSRASHSAIMKAMLSWFAILTLISGFYIFNKDDSYTLNNSVSPTRIVTDNGEMQVKRAPDGHFWLMTQINGRNMPMMVDTGASMVVLSKKDASKLGINMADLNFNGSSYTANGKVSYARMRLAEFTIGNVSFKNFLVTVNGGEMEVSLLGLDALNKFSSYEMRGDTMILRP